MSRKENAATDQERRWSDCPHCAGYWRDNADAIIFAASSVGIERGLTTNQAIAVYMRERHDHAC